MAKKLDWSKRNLQRKVASQGAERTEIPLLRSDGAPRRGNPAGISGRFRALKKRIATEKKEEERQVAVLRARLVELETAQSTAAEDMARIRRMILMLEKRIHPFPVLPKIGKRRRSRRKTGT